ncbi:alpha/beta fold hydrolase [Micromonospora sp. NBC_01699]|uniref:alpha/beta hydrolase n=1 Tax=Micromonospora sp. NBC_01699 TaxID=2975984 RepID=UPI002E28C2CC|nr:alpha/beta hydrolase [Micromonospora sp. NBC_01699]
MRGTIRTTIGVLAPLVLLLGATAVPAVAVPAGAVAAGTATNGWRPPPLDWQPCPDRPDDAALRCATLAVPVDWSRPRGATFPLALAKRAATGPGSRIGPLLVNPGGPGDSGVDAVVGRYERYGSPEIRSRFDLIGFDPRGIARSNPIRCSGALLAERPFAVPANQSEYRALVAYNHRLYDDCKANTGPLFDHVDSVNVAHDMDAIRAALGVRQISYYGASYGTLMGQMYAENYPNRVRALVMDSTMDHSGGTGAFVRNESIGAENSFAQFVAGCGRDPSCALHGQDVPGIFASLMRRADDGTLVDPVTGQSLTWHDLSGRVLRTFYGPDWNGLADLLVALSGSTPTPVGSATRPAGTAADELVKFPLPVMCQDWALPVGGLAGFHRYVDLAREVSPNMRGSAPAIMALGVCLGWKGEVSNPQHRLRVRTELPLLVVNSLHDPITPYEWAVGVADQLGRNGRLVTFEGPGHGVYPGTPCTTSYVDRYLVDRTLPPSGATCAAPPTPARMGADAERRDALPGLPGPVRPGWAAVVS